MKEANKLEYQGHKGFVNILRAQRRGLISSEILDSSKFANIYSQLTLAYSRAKTFAENSLAEPMRSAIRQREYEKINSEYNQETGNLDQLYKDAGLNETLNIPK